MIAMIRTEKELGALFKGTIESIERYNDIYKVHKGYLVDPQISEIIGDHVPEYVSYNKVPYVFSEAAEKLGLKSNISKPHGYLNYEDSLLEYMQERFEDVYNDVLDEIEDGHRMGTTHSVEAVLGIDKDGEEDRKKLLKNIRQSFVGKSLKHGKQDKDTILPIGVDYTDLKFLSLDDEGKKLIDDFLRERVSLTQATSVKRSLGNTKESREETYQNIVNRFEASKAQLKEYVGDRLDELITDFKIGHSFHVTDSAIKGNPILESLNANPLSLNDLDGLINGNKSLEM